MYSNKCILERQGVCILFSSPPDPGVKLVAECLALSSAEETQERARNLLYQLSTVRNLLDHPLNTCFSKVVNAIFGDNN